MGRLSDDKPITTRPCPFCGSAPHLTEKRFGFEPESRWALGCPTCGICLGWFEDEAAAVERWNRRAENG